MPYVVADDALQTGLKPAMVLLQRVYWRRATCSYLSTYRHDRGIFKSKPTAGDRSR